MTHKTVLVLRDPRSPDTTMRCEAFGGFLQRLAAAEGTPTELVLGAAEPAGALGRLAAAASLVVDGTGASYVPSASARDRVAREDDGTWPKAVASRQRKDMRRVQGAVFHFPLESSVGHLDGPHRAEAASVDAFVTDWTGMPSACAMAIHPAHPLSPGLPPGEAAAFTGRFCRHPLTGDLLPIWVADWVKPDFGTGAVVLNPGHNRMDLDFARRVGLPVRFSLAPDGYDGSPKDWVEPPFIRSGVAFRTGGTDGLAFREAGDAHIRTAVERGLAEPRTDAGFGAFPVATVEPGGDVELACDTERRTVATAGGATPVRVMASPVVSAVEESLREGELTVVSPSTQVEHDLLALRLLLAEAGIEPPVKRAPHVVLVGNVASVKDRPADDVLRLALLVGVGPLETVALKPQQLEPCERFLAVHERLAQTDPQPDQPVSAEVAKTAGQVKAALARGDLKRAFTPLYRLQKGLAKGENVGDGDLRRYMVLAHVLAAVGGPHLPPSLAPAWQEC